MPARPTTDSTSYLTEQLSLLFFRLPTQLLLRVYSVKFIAFTEEKIISVRATRQLISNDFFFRFSSTRLCVFDAEQPGASTLLSVSFNQSRY